ncbi:MAG: hypothetical protein LBJ02_05465 [Bifidobacteriaceae bacterium]|jgi:hypothetical protein|nr:hypothetical protein [Bifidobacteriaceae bacterium]
MTFLMAFQLVACFLVTSAIVRYWQRWRAKRDRDSLVNVVFFVCGGVLVAGQVVDYATAPQAVLAVVGVTMGVWSGLGIGTGTGTEPGPTAADGGASEVSGDESGDAIDHEEEGN